MSVTEENEVVELVRRVQSWPMSMRIALARQILQSLESTSTPESPPILPRGPTAADVMSMFKTDKPAPDDATVKQWIGEYRMGKYGK